MITARTLPVDEWPKLAASEPFATYGLPTDDGHTIIHVLEDDGRIVGNTILQDVVQWHFNIDPAYQGNPLSLSSLFAAGLRELQAGGVPHVHTTIPDQLPQVQYLAERLGFVRAPAGLYLLAVPPKET